MCIKRIAHTAEKKKTKEAEKSIEQMIVLANDTECQRKEKELKPINITLKEIIS